MEDFLKEEVESAIQSLKRKKAPAIDDITTDMIQAAGESSVTMMHDLCNIVYKENKCPDDWRKAVIVPIHRKNDKCDCKNYRGIS